MEKEKEEVVQPYLAPPPPPFYWWEWATYKEVSTENATANLTKEQLWFGCLHQAIVDGRLKFYVSTELYQLAFGTDIPTMGHRELLREPAFLAAKVIHPVLIRGLSQAEVNTPPPLNPSVVYSMEWMDALRTFQLELIDNRRMVLSCKVP